jgi:NAD(P)-dependent dehydrogenase (short-subunit alcohol dehydrogenase family)
MTTLNGKVALITGAAQGIGAATARELAQQGCALVLTDVDGDKLHAVANELGEQRALAIVADVTDLESMQEAVAAGIERFGGIDLVLANAGIGSYGSVLHVDPAAFKRVIDINLLGVFYTVRAALPSVIERRGYVLVVSSMAAFAAAPGLAAYNASKAGCEHFANALRLEVAYLGVDVGTAHMSWIDTPLVRDAKQDLASFRTMLATLPKPLAKTTSVQKCAEVFVAGMERRKRRVFVPRWVALVAGARTLLNSRFGERQVAGRAAEAVPQMDAEVAALGRSTSARNEIPDTVTTTSR